MKTGAQLIEHLNLSDECNWIEAKRGQQVDRSIMETICAFANEPGLGGGYLILGVIQQMHSLFPAYEVCGVETPDKLQLDISTQCASRFNQPIRPDIRLELIDGRNVLIIHVAELADGQKPVYFANEKLPGGAYRRIGSSDQRCTDDDLFIFYNKEDGFDSSIVQGASLEDISEDAISRYRQLRERVNPYAEELQYNDADLLQALGCVKKEKGELQPTYAGLLLFGSRMAHRRLMPMIRVDYIRVPGNEWIEDPDARFTTIDMRGSLLEMVQRVFSQITDDLPKGFLLPEGAVQAESIGLPSRVLREAIVNALMHRTYRVNQPIQIIRYSNRLEIKNPGFSLKPEEALGEPGSKNRNPFIAAVFHETNLAETKGSGIRTMRALMEKVSLMPPTFESDHGQNEFTARLLLHHFLGKQDLLWLTRFEAFELNEAQKTALVFTKEVGAIDNPSFRQLNNVDTLRASADLRDLRKKDLLVQKGRGKATYYIPGAAFQIETGRLSTESEPVPAESEPVPAESEPVLAESERVRQSLLEGMPTKLTEQLSAFQGRVSNREELEGYLCALCDERPFSISELALLLDKGEKYLLNQFVKPLREAGRLSYTIPDMPNHPRQAYTTPKTSAKDEVKI